MKIKKMQQLMTKVTNAKARDRVNSIENACFQIRKQAKLSRSRSQLYQRIFERSKLFWKRRDALYTFLMQCLRDLRKNEQFSRPQNGAPRAPEDAKKPYIALFLKKSRKSEKIIFSGLPGISQPIDLKLWGPTLKPLSYRWADFQHGRRRKSAILKRQFC